MAAEPDLVATTLFGAPCALALVDGDGTIQHANEELLRLVDLPRAQVVGIRTLSSLLTMGGRIMIETHLLPQLAHSGTVREVALDVARDSGERVPVLLNATAATPGLGDGWIVVAMLETRLRRRYEDDLLEARRLTQAAHDRAAALAQTLQQSLIPPEPPAVPHLELSASYRPAGDGHEVGGDFYDVFQVGPGQWFVVLGDVSGKGAHAAVVTSFVRYTVRALAAMHRDPAEILHLLDTALSGHETDRYCTVVLVLLERVDADWEVVLGLAGHPAALVRSPGGAVRELGEPGTPIGLVAAPSFHTVRHRLGADTLTLYTDGVTEARSAAGLYGEERLVALLGGLPHDPAAITESVVSAALRWQDGRPSDDIAVVTVAAR